jgi:hypothetical protein
LKLHENPATKIDFFFFNYNELAGGMHFYK